MPRRHEIARDLDVVDPARIGLERDAALSVEGTDLAAGLRAVVVAGDERLCALAVRADLPDGEHGVEVGARIAERDGHVRAGQIARRREPVPDVAAVAGDAVGGIRRAELGDVVVQDRRRRRVWDLDRVLAVPAGRNEVEPEEPFALVALIAADSNLVVLIVCEIEPFGERVEGLCLCLDAT